MSSEPLTTDVVPEVAESAETGLLVTMLLLVLFGTAAMLYLF
ncbi:hypothetical protein ACWT_6475 [Actinoplanes sp. SE50]|nr:MULTISPECIES: hypothetical protein [unclassified Actinoplanes]AEV87488.1 hypothetical protein ACPL_6606 [Actinoplanes sp. SE50/110]ATO85890.1 hypothetical protein ACWT_6475 [Actinoplanes sp. SE50]SLM03304.1 hypothetical protein ACSP50_6593 [Actinoplanes sp. SE50/110]